MAENFQKRQPAFYVEIKEVIEGNYVKTEGWNPNYITTSFGLNVSRVTIYGTVIEVDNNSIIIDDSTGQINVRAFDEFIAFKNLKSGDYVLLVGKIRQFDNENYVTPEICRTIDSKWSVLRKKNIEKLKKLFIDGKIENIKVNKTVSFSSGVDQVKNLVEEAVEKTEKKEASLIEDVLNYIDEEDNGNGVEKVKILDHFDDAGIVEIVDTLIMEGDVFEIKPGIFKVLK